MGPDAAAASCEMHHFAVCEMLLPVCEMLLPMGILMKGHRSIVFFVARNVLLGMAITAASCWCNLQGQESFFIVLAQVDAITVACLCPSQAVEKSFLSMLTATCMARP